MAYVFRTNEVADPNEDTDVARETDTDEDAEKEAPMVQAEDETLLPETASVLPPRGPSKSSDRKLRQKNDSKLYTTPTIPGRTLQRGFEEPSPQRIGTPQRILVRASPRKIFTPQRVLVQTPSPRRTETPKRVLVTSSNKKVRTPLHSSGPTTSPRSGGFSKRSGSLRTPRSDLTAPQRILLRDSPRRFTPSPQRVLLQRTPKTVGTLQDIPEQDSARVTVTTPPNVFQLMTVSEKRSGAKRGTATGKKALGTPTPTKIPRLDSTSHRRLGRTGSGKEEATRSSPRRNLPHDSQQNIKGLKPQKTSSEYAIPPRQVERPGTPGSQPGTPDIRTNPVQSSTTRRRSSLPKDFPGKRKDVGESSAHMRKTPALTGQSTSREHLQTTREASPVQLDDPTQDVPRKVSSGRFVSATGSPKRSRHIGAEYSLDATLLQENDHQVSPRRARSTTDSPDKTFPVSSRHSMDSGDAPDGSRQISPRHSKGEGGHLKRTDQFTPRHSVGAGDAPEGFRRVSPRHSKGDMEVPDGFLQVRPLRSDDMENEPKSVQLSSPRHSIGYSGAGEGSNIVSSRRSKSSAELPDGSHQFDPRRSKVSGQSPHRKIGNSLNFKIPEKTVSGSRVSRKGIGMLASTPVQSERSTTHPAIHFEGQERSSLAISSISAADSSNVSDGHEVTAPANTTAATSEAFSRDNQSSFSTLRLPDDYPLLVQVSDSEGEIENVPTTAVDKQRPEQAPKSRKSSSTRTKGTPGRSQGRRRSSKSDAMVSMPPSEINKLVKRYSVLRMTPEARQEIQKVVGEYVRILLTDLTDIAKAAKRNIASLDDAVELMRRHGTVTDKRPIEVLIAEFLPLDVRSLLIPIATSKNKIVPVKKKRSARKSRKIQSPDDTESED